MASLQASTTTSLTTDSSTAGSIICTNSSSVQQWSGYAGVPTPYYDPFGNYVNIFANTGGYAWVTGFVAVPANQSYNTNHAFYFALSRYGLEYTWCFNDGLMGLSVYQDPSDANINYLRVTNLYNASWAYAHYHFNVTVFTPSNSITSSILTRIN